MLFWILCLAWYDSGYEELLVLPQHTKVIVTANNQTKSVLVELQGVVKKTVGLGGYYWLMSLPLNYLVSLLNFTVLCSFILKCLFRK
jgi:hypothetical protein